MEAWQGLASTQCSLSPDRQSINNIIRNSKAITKPLDQRFCRQSGPRRHLLLAGHNQTVFPAEYAIIINKYVKTVIAVLISKINN
jgi:hypothetical protein